MTFYFWANTCTAGFKEILCRVLYQEMILTCLSEEKEERTVRDGPLEKLGGEGNFRAAGIFFRHQIPWMNFFRP